MWLESWMALQVWPGSQAGRCSCTGPQTSLFQCRGAVASKSPEVCCHQASPGRSGEGSGTSQIGTGEGVALVLQWIPFDTVAHHLGPSLAPCPFPFLTMTPRPLWPLRLPVSPSCLLSPLAQSWSGWPPLDSGDYLWEALLAPPLSPGARLLCVCWWWGLWLALFPDERPGRADPTVSS